MTIQLSLLRIDRHAAWGGRPISAGILLSFVGLIAAAIVFEPSRAEPQAGINQAPISGSFVSSPCIPHDSALGNAGGDPYGFYAFNRDEDLALLRATSCPPVVAGLSEREPAGRVEAAFELVAQNDSPEHVAKAR